jgi:hypothetical protein
MHSCDEREIYGGCLLRGEIVIESASKFRDDQEDSTCAYGAAAHSGIQYALLRFRGAERSQKGILCKFAATSQLEQCAVT